MNSETNLLSEYLMRRYGGSRCGVYPRAATALYVLFRSIRETQGDGTVIIPAICCDVVALAAEYVGLEPVFADVDPSNHCISPNWLAEQLQPETRAVVLAQVFGQTFDLSPFQKLRDSHDFVLIEDIAQSVGGAFDGKEVGTGCDFTVLSFANDKIIAGNGGALVHRTSRFDDVIAEIATGLPRSLPDEKLKLKSQSWRNFCHSLYDLNRTDWSVDPSQTFRSMAEHYRDLIVRAGEVKNEALIVEQFEALDKIRASRFRRYEFYAQNTRNPLLHVVPMPDGSMCWRSCVLADNPDNALTLTRQLREAGIHASNHYFSLARLFEGRNLPVADDIASRIINLWVDDSVTDETLERTVDVLNTFSPVKPEAAAKHV